VKSRNSGSAGNRKSLRDFEWRGAILRPEWWRGTILQNRGAIL